MEHLTDAEHLSVSERWSDLSLLKVRLRQLADPKVANPFEKEWADSYRISTRIAELEREKAKEEANG